MCEDNQINLGSDDDYKDVCVCLVELIFQTFPLRNTNIIW